MKDILEFRISRKIPDKLSSLGDRTIVTGGQNYRHWGTELSSLGDRAISGNIDYKHERRCVFFVDSL